MIRYVRVQWDTDTSLKKLSFLNNHPVIGRDRISFWGIPGVKAIKYFLAF